MLFEERNQLIDPEICENMAMPVERGGSGLAGEFDHFLHRFAVPRYNQGLDLDILFLKIVDGFVAPRAAAFDIKNGKGHGKSGMTTGIDRNLAVMLWRDKWIFRKGRT